VGWLTWHRLGTCRRMADAQKGRSEDRPSVLASRSLISDPFRQPRSSSALVTSWPCLPRPYGRRRWSPGTRSPRKPATIGGSAPLSMVCLLRFVTVGHRIRVNVL